MCSFPGLPDDEETGLDSGFMVMTAEQIKEIFAPVIKEVTDLVQGQVDGLRAKGEIVSGIVLVGGFGQSDYLYRHLKGHFTSAAPPPSSERPTHGRRPRRRAEGAGGQHGHLEEEQDALRDLVRDGVRRGEALCQREVLVASVGAVDGVGPHAMAHCQGNNSSFLFLLPRIYSSIFLANLLIP